MPAVPPPQTPSLNQSPTPREGISLPLPEVWSHLQTQTRQQILQRLTLMINRSLESNETLHQDSPNQTVESRHE